MKFTRLGRTGLEVSRLCLGCMTYGSSAWRPWVLDEAASRVLIRRALEHGINFFDTADMYSRGLSEEVTGRALRDFARREDVVVATKVRYGVEEGPNKTGLSRRHIMAAVDASLRRLGMDYIDLYQIHRTDPNTPIEETIEALNDVVKAGKALYIGASTMRAWELAKYLHTADRMGATRFVSMQNHLNLVYREEEREMMPLCRDEGVGVIPYSPLARGFLAGNRRPGKLGEQGDTTRARSDTYADGYYFSENDFAVVARASEIARTRGASPARIALAWVLAQPGVTSPIVGASRIEQLDEAVAALDIALTAEEAERLEEPYRPHEWRD
jgi:aryl-alcohol dehydrogenase-like predicted oxidoreductase